jgi:protein SCO1/2
MEHGLQPAIYHSKAVGVMTRLYLSLLVPLAVALAGCGASDPQAQPPGGSEDRRPVPAGRCHRQDRHRSRLRRALSHRLFRLYLLPRHLPDRHAGDRRGVEGAGGECASKAAKIVPIFVTVDPERDTPAIVGRFATTFHRASSD